MPSLSQKIIPCQGWLLRVSVVCLALSPEMDGYELTMKIGGAYNGLGFTRLYDVICSLKEHTVEACWLIHQLLICHGHMDNFYIFHHYRLLPGQSQGESLVEPAMAAEAANRHLLLSNVAYLLQVRICTLTASDTARWTLDGYFNPLVFWYQWDLSANRLRI